MDVLVILILIMLNGFLSLSEIAVVSFKKIRLENNYGKKKPKGVKYALRLQEHQEDFLASIQVGITLISLINGFIGGSTTAKYFVPLFVWMKMSPVAALNTSIVVSIILVTFITIVFGELVPKTIALSNPERMSVHVAPMMSLISKIFAPVVKLLAATTTLVDKVLGVKINQNHITEDELRDIINEAGETGVIEVEQNEMHEKIFYFSDKRAKHIMTHRSEVDWVDINLPPDAFTRQLYEFKSSRVLVCDKHIEQYLGVLRIKEYFINKYKKVEFQVSDMLETPLVFSEATEAQDILNEFKKAQYYFGVVVDEFGILEGIVTMHDIMENIVGEIPEEEEVVEPDVCVRDDKTVLVNGDAPIEVLLNVIDGLELDFEEMDYATVAGFILDHIEKNPELGDHFDFMGYHVEIVDMDRNRIDKVLIEKSNDFDRGKKSADTD